MTSIKIKFRPSIASNESGSPYIQIIHNRETRNVKIPVKVLRKDWFNDKLPEIVTDIKTKVQSSVDYIEQLKSNYTTADIITAYNSYDQRMLFNFMACTIKYLQGIGHRRTAETYLSTLNSIKRFTSDTDIELSQITGDFVKRYRNYLISSGVQPNTVIFYIRVFRAAYNRAVDKELTFQRFPFKHITTHAEKTVKRAISSQQLKELKDYNLEKYPSINFARDILMFSFYTRGMSFIDMAYLKKADLRNSILSYRRRKTNQLLHIHWEPCMQQIVDKYAGITSSSPYMLPIITNMNYDKDKQYKVAIHTVNYNLKKLAEMLGIETNLTSYVARHTWASIAKKKNIPISIISEGMGHESEKTTQIYLASLDNYVIDNANRDIITDL